MATPTLTLLNHTLLSNADTITNWTLLATAEPDIKVEGTNSMSGIFRADLSNGYYTAAAAPITAAGKTFRGWILTNNLPYMDTVANGGYELLVWDAVTTEYKTMFGSENYPGGWFNVVWDMDTFTTLTAANIRRWGFRAQHAIAAKNVINTWVDVMRYLDGFSMVGGTSGDKVRLADIATLDKTSGYGVLSNYEGVYFCTGALQFGTGATAHHLDMNGQVLVFIQKPVKAGLYKVLGVGSGTNISIVGSVLRSTGTTDATRFSVDFSEANLAALTFTGNLIVRASTVAFKVGQVVTSNIFDDCGQITHGGADMRFSSVSKYEGTVNTSALIYNVASDPAGEIDSMSFTKGTAATHAIEFGTTSPTTITLNGLSFSGYNASNGQNDSALHIKRTTGTVTINLSGVSGNVSYRTDGATVTLVNSTTLAITGLKNPTEVRVFKAGTTTAIAGDENVITGTFTSGIDAAANPSVDISIISLGYQNLRLLGISTTSSVSIPIQQTIDRQYLNP